MGVRAWEALDSRAHPTVGCVLSLEGGFEGRALVPTGASIGRFEVSDLRDGGTRYAGLGVRDAVERIEKTVAADLVGLPVGEVDARLDGPSNVTLAVSLAAARAAAAASGLPLWHYLSRGGEYSLPCPMVNVFSGGRHAEGGVRIQDFLAVPLAAKTFAEAMEVVWRVRRQAARLTEERHGTLMSRLVADEGGLAVLAGDDAEPLELLARAIEDVGEPVGVAIDVAATQIEHPEEFLGTLEGWCARYPIVSIEDPLGDDDWDGWADATRRFGHLQLVGDDLFATSAQRLEKAVGLGVANTVLVKPNQVGTLGRAAQTMAAARRHGYATVVSARSGDTEDDVIADLAVGWNAGQIKIGSIMRSERLAKYNRLLQIEALDGVPYRGWQR
ncbi:phosphopyruvate hydratase [Peterkaempfera bronchialis]|uniref:Enolase n=2 Tax=Peterkaempfera bronchialis TaxID=2126346 RepID=A0A345T6T5_9ACTN|nr:phosphopyruvate hydratase [Peterkaempfera bronchialis]